jgi:hypothetical protein
MRKTLTAATAVSLLVTAYCFAQSLIFPGPGAAPASALWTPTGTLVWYAADQITGVTSGSALASWSDLSGNTHTLSQGTSADQPTYNTNIQNGLPGVQFNGSSTYMVTGSFTWNQPSTVFIVANNTSGTNKYWVDGLSAATRGISAQSGPIIHVGVSTGYALSTTSLASYSVLGGVFNGSSTVASFNGNEGTGNGGTGSASGLTIGASGSGGGNWITGYIFEVVGYGSGADANLRACLEGYLAWKWGLQSNLPSGHAYKSAAPTTSSNCT